ncbi:MAG: hypothetical protein ACSHW0_07330 [Thalassotalea sp.]
MQSSVVQNKYMERRQSSLNSEQLWSRLTLSQQFSASSLNQYGYDLAFIRNTDDGPLAILLCDQNAATIDNHGEINTSPDIIVR